MAEELTILPWDEYRAKLNEYLETQGPNPGNGFNGKWSWYIIKEAEFVRKYRICPEPPKSTAAPTSFKDFMARFK